MPDECDGKHAGLWKPEDRVRFSDRVLMNKVEAEKVVAGLGADARRDLLMYLAERFDYRVVDENGESATYFLSTGGNLTVRHVGAGWVARILSRARSQKS